jgi:hypothetical protein
MISSKTLSHGQAENKAVKDHSYGQTGKRIIHELSQGLAGKL